MLALLMLPIALLRIAFYAVRGLVDAMRGRRQLCAETTVLISAPRDAVWRFITADRIVFDGPPIMEITSEPLPEGENLSLTRIVINGQEWGRVVSRRLASDEAAGTTLGRAIPHELTHPPELGNDGLMGLRVEARPEGAALTIFNDVMVQSFRERIAYPLGVRHRAFQIKRQCEKEAGAQHRVAALANHGLVLSIVALLSFWYLLGWQDALLLAAIVVLHEGGHAAAMRMVGITVQGIYLVPFFGGAAVPKTAYKSQAHLGFVALMGPGFSLIPTFALAAMFWATHDAHLPHAVSLFAAINAANLLPIYPLDGGLILNALLGSLSRRLAFIAGWIGVLAGLGVAVYLQSFLLGIPFLLFALQRYLSGTHTPELKPLSFAAGARLMLGLAATFALYVFAFVYAGDLAMGSSPD